MEAGASRPDSDPPGGGVLIRDRHGVVRALVQAGDQFRVVALAGEVQQHNVAPRLDQADGLDRLVIAQMAAAAHDAALEMLRPAGGFLKFRAVVRLDRQDVHAGEVLDQRIGDSPHVGRKAQVRRPIRPALAREAEAERGDPVVVVVGEYRANDGAVPQRETAVEDRGGDAEEAEGVAVRVAARGRAAWCDAAGRVQPGWK